METVKMDVVVHKANISLMIDESIGDYTYKLSEAGRVFLKKKLKMDKNGGGWMVEAEPTKAIFSTYDSKTPSKYYSISYTRDESGKFSFEKPVEVKRVTTFMPKQTSVTVSKSVEQKEEIEQEVWEETETEKSLWGSVI